MDSHLEKLQTALSEAIAGASEEDLNRNLPGKWCAAEVLEHLYLTYTGTIKGFSGVLEAGKPLVTAPTLRHRMRTLILVGFGHMPEGRKAPPAAQPRGLPATTVRAEIIAKIAEMDRIISQCESQLGANQTARRSVFDHPILDHPILGPLSARQWRKFHLVHGLHHVKQIRRLRETVREENPGKKMSTGS